MKKYLKLFGAFVRVAFRIQTAYRSTYFAGIVGQWLSYGATFATLVIVFALVRVGFPCTLLNLLRLVLVVLGAALIQAAALIASSVMSFFTVNENPVLDFLLFNMKKFTDYPITVYPRGIQFILTFILPFAFMNFYPASLLLGKAVPAGFPAVLPYLTPAVGALCFALSVVLWNWGLSHYKSTGS